MRLTRDPTLVPHPWHLELSRWWAVVAVLIALTLIFVADRSTGSPPFQHLYYLPIMFASVQFGYRGSLTVALAAVVLYHLTNPHVLNLQYEERDIVQVALFVAVGIASAKFADDARRLHRLATTDDLTGLHNLRSFEARLRALMSASLQDGTPLALLVLDVDRLKSLNDAHGHLTGAEAVKTVGRVIAERLRDDAIACRYGGDEFVIALPGFSEADAITFAGKLRSAVHACAPVLDGMPFPAGTISVSVGIAFRPVGAQNLPPAVLDPDEAGDVLFRLADAALYAAKKAGRNRISIGPAA